MKTSINRRHVFADLFAAALLIILSGGPGRADDSCINVETTGDQALDFSCLNRRLTNKVPSPEDLPSAAPPLDATSPSIAVGTFNESATRQRMGNAFGNSASRSVRPPSPRPFRRPAKARGHRLPPCWGLHGTRGLTALLSSPRHRLAALTPAQHAPRSLHAPIGSGL